MYRMKALISSSRLPTEGYINVIMETDSSRDRFVFYARWEPWWTRYLAVSGVIVATGWYRRPPIVASTLRPRGSSPHHIALYFHS
jgi:hypothetical protein